jgi:hypothetical protein
VWIAFFEAVPNDLVASCRPKVEVFLGAVLAGHGDAFGNLANTGL